MTEKLVPIYIYESDKKLIMEGYMFHNETIAEAVGNIIERAELLSEYESNNMISG